MRRAKKAPKERERGEAKKKGTYRLNAYLCLLAPLVIAISQFRLTPTRLISLAVVFAFHPALIQQRLESFDSQARRSLKNALCIKQGDENKVE
jgi:hypothetical protein